MKGEVVTTVRLPIAEIAAEAKSNNQIMAPLADYRIEADVLVLSFSLSKGSDPPASAGSAPSTASRSRATNSRESPGRKRKRHRMKTRGWEVVATISNSYNQRANVYKPFVEALSDKAMTMAQKRAAAAKILRSNGNVPNDSSVEYYLMNTLEFIDQQSRTQGKTNGERN